MEAPSDRGTPTLRIFPGLPPAGTPDLLGPFALRLALHARDEGWRVAVYRPAPAGRAEEAVTVDRWLGIERISLPPGARPVSDAAFDRTCLGHATGRPGACLVLGRDRAGLTNGLRRAGLPVVALVETGASAEGARSPLARALSARRERTALRNADRLIVGHPAIADALEGIVPREAVSLVPPGARPVGAAPVGPALALGLQPGRYLIAPVRPGGFDDLALVAEAFSRRDSGLKLLVVGDIAGALDSAALKQTVRANVVLAGHDPSPARLDALRFHARASCHGRFPGTDPDLVAALAGGTPILARKTGYNLWSGGHDQFYFTDGDECARMIAHLARNDGAVERARRAARSRAAAVFDWDRVLPAALRVVAEIGAGTSAARPRAAGTYDQDEIVRTEPLARTG